MADFLLELLTEEIPARMQKDALVQLHNRLSEGLSEAALDYLHIKHMGTPRRLSAIVYGLSAAGDQTTEERRGPRVDAPVPAITGFLKSTGLTRDQLQERDTPKGRFLYASIVTEGRSAQAVLADLVPAIVRAFDWPKSMRWGIGSATTSSLRWVRPLSSIVALLDDVVVPFDIAGIPSGRTTRGHRFMSSGPIEIGSVSTYASQLLDAKVQIYPDERNKRIIIERDKIVAAAGLRIVEDPFLVTENAGLTEWPVPLLGHFDPAFLDVPREVIQLTMRTNQKYFACTDADGNLAPAFVCVANLAAADGGVGIVAGNRKVLAARLSDAKFFWDADRAITLEARLPKLRDIVFHEKLGSVADKVERVAKLARWLVESGAIDPGAGDDRASIADLAEQAARLCKADLVSATVGEFPEVQGIAGGHLALAEGLDPRVAAAIRDHYKPVGQSDDVPIEPVTVAVALADKLDTLSAFFAIDQKPTGSRDPFALRRAGLGIVQIVQKSGLRLSLPKAVFEAVQTVRLQLMQNQSDISGPVADNDIIEFFFDRLKVQQREAGIRPDVIEAVFALGNEDDLVRIVARAKALQAFLSTQDGGNLLTGYKRGANMLRSEELKDGLSDGEIDSDLLVEPAELALAGALDAAVPAVAAAVAGEDFAGAMTALARLRPAVDAFFVSVTVNAADQEVRRNRLALLARLRNAVHSVADFSKVDGG